MKMLRKNLGSLSKDKSHVSNRKVMVTTLSTSTNYDRIVIETIILKKCEEIYIRNEKNYEKS